MRQVKRRTTPYRSIRKEDLILRDLLAADRTVLANERTLLSYVRTALACFAGGAGLLHFAEAGWVQGAGWVLVACAPLLLAVGVRRYLRVRKDLKPVRPRGA